MIRVTSEVIEIHRQRANKQIVNEKLKEIQLIQSIVLEKRADESS